MNLWSYHFSQNANERFKISALCSEDRNSDNFLFVFWEKRSLHESFWDLLTFRAGDRLKVWRFIFQPRFLWFGNFHKITTKIGGSSFFLVWNDSPWRNFQILSNNYEVFLPFYHCGTWTENNSKIFGWTQSDNTRTTIPRCNCMYLECQWLLRFFAKML